VTNDNFPTENQVVDFAAARAGRLSAELFERAGIAVTSELVPNQLTPQPDALRPSSIPEKSEIVRLGTEAMVRLASNRSRDWGDWKMVLRALEIGRHTAMQEAGTNKSRGQKYCAAMARWLRCHEPFQAIHKADRSRMFICLDNLPSIDDWREGLPAARQLRLNYPPTVLREWRRSQKPSAENNDNHSSENSVPRALLGLTELRRQLEIVGLARFRQAVMPPDWRAPLLDAALALASRERLIEALGKKVSPSKTARQALKSLKQNRR
jgi:hypothetical protein